MSNSVLLAQQDVITNLILEKQRLEGELNDALRESSRWRKIASAYEILTPPLGEKRVLKLAHRDGWGCAYCGRETFLAGRGGLKATVDHVVPKCKGGLDHITNCVLACDECNNQKADNYGI